MADAPRYRPERSRRGLPWSLLVLLLLVTAALAIRGLWPTPATTPTLVRVQGDVPRPATYPLERPTVHAALRAAGAEPPPGQDALVPEGYEVVFEHGRVRLQPPSQPMLVALPVDVNKATWRQLDALPGIGEATARKLVARRPYPDARAVQRSVGSAAWKRLEPFVRLSEVPPIDLNQATAAELERLPGVGPVLAARIVVDRADHGPFRQLQDLQRVPGVGPALVEQVRTLVRL